MIRNITSVECDDCGHVEQYDGAGPPASLAIIRAGWSGKDGQDRCPACVKAQGGKFSQ